MKNENREFVRIGRKERIVLHRDARRQSLQPQFLRMVMGSVQGTIPDSARDEEHIA
jgi:hypothetical protein